MEELSSLLAKREIVNFDPLKQRVRCYAHIINICSSHVISSMTSVSKSYLKALKVPYDSADIIRGEGAADDVDIDVDDVDIEIDEFDPNSDIDQLELGDRCTYRNTGKKDVQAFEDWIAGIKRDPLTRARRLIHFLRSSGQRRARLAAIITEGNQKDWFIGDHHRPITIAARHLLRDVKTRWDSVYAMLLRLRDLRQVSFVSAT